jgi:hypothetical protein
MPIKYLNRSNNSTAISAGNSVLFNGSNQYLSIASNSAFDFGAGDFTVEGWVYLNDNSLPAIVGTRTNDTSSTIRWCIFVQSGFLTCDVWNTSNARIAQFAFQSTIPTGTWTHFVLVRSGTSFRLYQNGVQSTNGATSSDAVANNSTAINIGSFIGSAISNLNGNISNLRIVKGTAVYTSNFTPSTTPLTAIANTSLLTCNAPTIVDSSNNNFTITNNGAATVSSTVPFTASFVSAPNGVKFRNSNNSGTATPTGNSVQFNGTSQYLSLPNNAALNLGSNNFTMEAFVYIPNVSGNKNIFYINGNNSSYSAICLYVQDSRFAFLATQTGGYPWTLQIGAVGPTISSNTWYHVAATRSGNSFYVFVNGTLVSGAPYSLSGALYNGTTNIIGYQPTVPSYFNGYITNARVINGTALYTASFTAPTAPLTAIANTSLLTCNAATIVDGSTNNLTITNNNSATVSSTTPFTVASAASTMKMRKVFADPLTYMVATGGDLITTSGSYKIHKFTTVGTSSFTISNLGIAPSIEYLIVGGGGGGGYVAGVYDSRGGGGGAGGFRTGSISSGLAISNYSIIVGSGGSLNNNGQDSSFLTVTSLGGGGGGFSSTAAKTGGSGGGGGAIGGAGNYSGAAGTAGQGNSGGGGGTDSVSYRYGGGGGGAGSVGVTAINASVGGAGGSGSYSNITGINIPYAGGGAAGASAGGAGVGGGGAGNATGSANTGGGGGGGYTTYQYSNYPGGTGGSGIVIIKYRYAA